MVHLLPLPGAPSWSGELSSVEKRALADTRALIEGGVDGILFENYGDAPFTKKKVNRLTVSSMTRVILKCVDHMEIPFGINVLRNDWDTALAIAATTGAAFIRVNVLSGAYVTDQGIIEGVGHACLRRRRTLEHEIGRKILILGDAHTKHGRPLLEQSLIDTVHDLTERVGVDGVIITGSRSGEVTKVEDVKQATKAAKKIPVLVGSGITAENIKDYLETANGFIVGSSLKENRILTGPVEKKRVEILMQRIKS
jgi:membrane complex biogenesis BtpA family protein